MDGTVQIVVPAAVLTVLVTLVIAYIGRTKAKQLVADGNGNVMMKLINQVKDGQEECRNCLNEVKTQTVVQTDVLKDIRDLIRKES